MQEYPPILAAEDDEDDFHFLFRAIRNAGLPNPVLRFRDGGELIRFLEQMPASGAIAKDQPWLLLLDLGMPVVSGFDVLEWLSRWGGTPALHVVVLSGFYHQNDIDRATALGANEYCIKPITAQTIAKLVAGCAPQPQ
jgi:CheY-like chemotaxis protein